jgi:hypothetical protein
MFPIDLVSKLLWNDIAVDQDGFVKRLLTTISDRLSASKVGNLDMDDGQISFEVPPFRFVGSWNLLVPIDKGKIDIHLKESTLSIVFWVSFKRMLVIITIFMVLFGGVVAAASGLSLRDALCLVLIGWLWIFGGNALNFLLRFRAFLKRAVRDELHWEHLR